MNRKEKREDIKIKIQDVGETLEGINSDVMDTFKSEDGYIERNRLGNQKHFYLNKLKNLELELEELCVK